MAMHEQELAYFTEAHAFYPEVYGLDLELQAVEINERHALHWITHYVHNRLPGPDREYTSGSTSISLDTGVVVDESYYQDRAIARANRMAIDPDNPYKYAGLLKDVTLIGVVRSVQQLWAEQLPEHDQTMLVNRIGMGVSAAVLVEEHAAGLYHLNDDLAAVAVQQGFMARREAFRQGLPQSMENFKEAFDLLQGAARG